MTKARLLSTAAIALTFATAAALNASAQTNKPNPEPAPAAQQNAPPAKIAPSIQAGEHKARPETTGQAEKPPVPGHVQAGEKSNTELKASPDRAGAADKSSADVKPKSDSSAAKDASKDASKDSSRDASKNTARDSSKDAAKDVSKDASKDSAAAKSSDSNKSRSTTGQGAAGAAKLSTEQRTKITTVIKKQNVKPVTHVNFSINIGTRVPASVHYYPLPTEVVTIYPEWRGFDYILIGDQIVVLDPGTHEIVAVLEA